MTMTTETVHRHQQVCANCGRSSGTREECLPPTKTAIYMHTFVAPACERCDEVVTVEITRRDAHDIGRYISRGFYMNFNWPESARRLMAKFEELAK